MHHILSLLPVPDEPGSEPEDRLLMTVAKEGDGEGHAVLMVRTDRGDFILDNKINEVKVWYRTRYDYVMRQSYLNTRIWMSLDPRDAGLAGHLLGRRPRAPVDRAGVSGDLGADER